MITAGLIPPLRRDPDHAGENRTPARRRQTWKRGTLARPEMLGQLTDRLSRDRFIAKAGSKPGHRSLEKPGRRSIIPMSIISKMKITASADPPAGATDIWQVRSADAPIPVASWGEYRTSARRVALP